MPRQPVVAGASVITSTRIGKQPDEGHRDPESEYEWAEESKVRVIDEIVGAEEAAKIAGTGWIAVQRDQVEAIGKAINETNVSNAQAIAIMMMIVGARIGERRMRDLVETMCQATEVPTEAIRISIWSAGPRDSTEPGRGADHAGVTVRRGSGVMLRTTDKILFIRKHRI